MKKYLWVLLLVPVLLSAQQPRERFAFQRLRTNAGSHNWLITSTGDDTSETFNLFSASSIQCCLSDTVGTWNDSVAYKIELLTASVDVDSAFQLSQTLDNSETTGGYRPVISINTPVAQYGKIVITGLTGNTVLSGLYGWIYINGWSNAEGMSKQLY